jgi:hypothetical protein
MIRVRFSPLVTSAKASFQPGMTPAHAENPNPKENSLTRLHQQLNKEIL